ncbi:ribosome maturation factor RimM [Spelaeicoccus albus]|uniref:Ribosome maturation factor RimM n=1 Tax=Spelaeicoccus albus TaxID=1280376 RepID=A0A7Z0D2N5_9MICO|nr:ribosome maturation factor RimM [Spelaeicoccus albus]NYI67742.1 16S rRNA processing protein RimM [Spelaeicoccus albus]
MNVVARIGRPHGIRGEVSVEVLTDMPREQFVVGAEFATEPDIGGLHLTSARYGNGRLLLAFEEITDRTRAEEIRNTRLLAASIDAEDDDAWDPAQLVGLTAKLASDGSIVGTVARLEHGPAQDLLVVSEPSGAEALVPFVHAIVPVVDIEAGNVLLDPPGGLLTDGDRSGNDV